MKNRDEIFKQFGSLSRKIMTARHHNTEPSALRAIEELSDLLPILREQLEKEYKEHINSLSKIGSV